MPTLETGRLRLRTWADADLDALAGIHVDAEVMRYIGPEGGPLSRDASHAWLTRTRRHWDERGFGLFAIEDAATGRLIGWTGPVTLHWLPELLPAVEVGWLLDRPFWGRGLGTEAAAAAVAFAFEELMMLRVVAIHHVANASSERVMQKLGMRWLRDTAHPRSGRALRVYEALARPQARSRSGRYSLPR